MYRPTEIPQPCIPSPCGTNAVCKEKNGAGSCACLPEYYGDPYSFCKPECSVNSDCDRSKACFNQKCRDPCPGVCGNNAECHVVNHSPSCVCIPGYSGNPSTGCREPPRSKFKKNFPYILYQLSFNVLQRNIFHLLIFVILHHVAHTVNVNNPMVMPFAHVVKAILAAHQHVDLNVLLALTVHKAWHAKTKSV